MSFFLSAWRSTITRYLHVGFEAHPQVRNYQRNLFGKNFNFSLNGSRSTVTWREQSKSITKRCSEKILPTPSGAVTSWYKAEAIEPQNNESGLMALSGASICRFRSRSWLESDSDNDSDSYRVFWRGFSIFFLALRIRAIHRTEARSWREYLGINAGIVYKDQ